MRRIMFFRFIGVATLALLSALSGSAQDATNGAGDDGSKLIYADFQSQTNGRPQSKRGGMTRLNRYSENPANPPQFRGLDKADPPAPAFARVTAEDTAAAFDYEMRIPNEWEGVNLEVFGLPDKDGKPVPDDISAYKYISLRLFAKGPQSIRLELISRVGSNLEAGYPMATFRVSSGFNTYKLKLDSFNQPEWATKLDFKHDVLKKLTSVTVGVFCDKCTLEKGTVVVDNIAFEK